VPGITSTPEPGPAPEAPASTRTLHITGAIPPEVWNRLGTRILPKLRSGSELKMSLDFSVTVAADSRPVSRPSFDRSCRSSASQTPSRWNRPRLRPASGRSHPAFGRPALGAGAAGAAGTGGAAAGCVVGCSAKSATRVKPPCVMVPMISMMRP
jgi:hypothetical protein